MMHEEVQIERRQHKRFRIKNRILTVQNREMNWTAHVVNISAGGMAVRYIDKGKLLTSTTEVDILKDSDVFMTGIPVTVMRDFRYKDDENFTTVMERQSCMKFGELTPDEHDHLDYLIMKYSWGEA